MSRKIAMFGVFIVLFLLGCALPQKKAKVISVEQTGASAITFPAELRGAYFIKRDDAVHYCAEPAPDVALDTLQKLAAEISAKLPAGEEIKGKVDSELSSKVVQLAGRTELILLAREMLYRACELTFNNPGDTQQAIEMYMRVADLVADLGKADRARAEAELRKATFILDSNGECLQGWIDKDATNVDTLKKWLEKNAEGISIPMFLYGSEYSSKRSEFMIKNNVQCN